MATASPYVFSPSAHRHLTPYLAALHASCISNDRMMGGFLPPLNNEKLLAWWRDRIAEVTAGARVILVLLLESEPGAKAKGAELMGVVMLSIPIADENAQVCGQVEKLLISPKYRQQGGAKTLMEALEADAYQRGRTTLRLDVETGSPAEAVFKKIGYTEIGKCPNLKTNAAGELRSETYFYKILNSF